MLVQLMLLQVRNLIKELVDENCESGFGTNRPFEAPRIITVSERVWNYPRTTFPVCFSDEGSVVEA